MCVLYLCDTGGVTQEKNTSLATVAIAIVIACHLCCHCIALFIASAFTLLPPSLPSCCLGWGMGGPYQSSAGSYFSRHRQCCHHHRHLCRPRNRPGGASPTTCGIPTFSRQLAPTWRGYCWCSCSRRHPPCRPTAAAACQRWQRQRCWQGSNKVNKDNDRTQQSNRQPTWRGNN